MGDRLQACKPSWYVTSHPGQLSLAIPRWVGAVSTSQSWDVNRHTARCTSPVSVVWQCKLVSGWGLMKRRSVPPYEPYGSGRTLRFFTFVGRPCVGGDRVICFQRPWSRRQDDGLDPPHHSEVVAQTCWTCALYTTKQFTLIYIS